MNADTIRENMEDNIPLWICDSEVNVWRAGFETGLMWAAKFTPAQITFEGPTATKLVRLSLAIGVIIGSVVTSLIALVW